MKISKSLLPAAALVALFAGCQDEDFGFTTKDVKSSKYADEFVKAFGEVDPNQDWSMAAETRALVNLPNIKGTAKMNIMTGEPKNPSTRLLGQIWLQDGQADFAFDAIEGKNSVFVTVEQEGKYKLYGQYNIANGMLCIGNVEMPVTRAANKEAFSATCPTTQSTTGNYLVDAEYATYPVFDHEAIKYKTDTKTYDEWKAATKSFVSAQNSTEAYPFTDESVRHFIVAKSIDWENSNLELKSGAVVNTEDLYVYNGSAKTLGECKALAESRGQGLQNTNGDFPFTIESVMVFETVSDEWNTWQEFRGFDWSDPKLKDGAYKIPTGEAITYSNQTKKIDDWKAEADANVYEAATNAQQYNGPWVNDSFTFITEDVVAGTDKAIYKGIFPEENWVLKDDIVYVDVTKDEHVKIQYLSGVETVPAEPWNVSLGNSLFGANAFFAEGIAYHANTKLGVYYDEAQMTEMEEGFQVHTTAAGPIELPFIFGCTDYSDQLGYVYWKDGDENDPNFDIRKLKHFILIEDGRPASNVTYNDGTADKAITGKTFSKDAWASLVTLNYNYVGTTYRVMYFGDDYNNAQGSYEFPSGYNIVFFISCLYRYDSESALFTDHNPHGNFDSFNYSVPKYNELLGHHYDHPGDYPAKKDMGQVKCLAWSRDGNTYMGFGDNCGDHDLNDMVFLVSGHFDAPDTKVAAVKWHLNYDGIHHDGEGNTKKDDDLFTQYSLKFGQSYIQPQQNGSNWVPTRAGYDFVGWSLNPEAEEGDEEISDTADKECTCYFAIWKLHEDPTPDPEWQSWIFACEDLGGSFDYDFNDLVFAVKKTAIPNSTNVKLELIPLAAGGTLSAHISYDNTDIGEIHSLLTGVPNTSFSKALNVGKESESVDFNPENKYELASSVDAGITVKDLKDKIKITVTQNTETGIADKKSSYTLSHVDHTKGKETPEIIILPEGWDWPTERTIITNVYSGFAEWNNNINKTDWIDPKNDGVTEGEDYIKNPMKGGPVPSSLGKDVTFTQITDPDTNNGNGVIKISRADLGQAVESGAVTIYIQGTVFNVNYYHFTDLNVYDFYADWNTNAWFKIGSEGSNGTDYVSWSLTAAEYQTLLSSKDDVELKWCNIRNVKVFIKSAE